MNRDRRSLVTVEMTLESVKQRPYYASLEKNLCLGDKF